MSSTTTENLTGRTLLHGRRAVRFEAIQHAVVPSSTRFNAAERDASLHLVERTLATQPGSVRRQLALLLAAIDTGCVLRHGKRLHRLPAERRLRLIRSLAGSRVRLLRLGMDGLGTLAKLGAFGQSGRYPALRYAPRKNGHDRA